MRRAGLALAYEGQGTPDSVLTIDDIVGLRLNADWVILSACNTGLASGNAGDSMSSLARGFFAAGSRTVLATQWAVESQSARDLTVGLFKNLGADTASSKADALSRTQREMIAGKYGALYRHPYFWAPFFISGDAARWTAAGVAGAEVPVAFQGLATVDSLVRSTKVKRVAVSTPRRMPHYFDVPTVSQRACRASSSTPGPRRWRRSARRPRSSRSSTPRSSRGSPIRPCASNSSRRA